MGGDVIYSHYNSRSRGVAILFRKGLQYKITQKLICSVGRYIIIELEINDVTFVLTNIYAPNEDSPLYFTNLFDTVNSMNNPHKMYGGDFNVVRDPTIDRCGMSELLKPNATAVVNKYVDENELIDIWRYENPNKKRYTWIRNNPMFSGSRLDYWLVSAPFLQHCISTDIPASFVGDHAPITIKLQTSANPRGKGYWKFNNSLLNDDQYVNMINELIDEVIVQHPGEDSRLVWEALKLRVCGETIKYSTFKKASSDNKLQALENKLKTIETSLSEDNQIFTQTSERWSQMLLIKNEINQLYVEKTKGAMIRSKATFLNMAKK